jgi:predicted ATPase
LRAATDLATLLCKRSKIQEARGVLSPAIHAFTEGHETRDLLKAVALQASMAGHEEALFS